MASKKSNPKVFNEAYVFAPSAEQIPTLAGTIKITPMGGEFSYAESWYNNPLAYALDPINLPLSPKTYHTTHKKNVFGVFLDAAPDAWGERILLLKYQSIPKNEIEKLLSLSGTGVGGIQFSLSRSKPKTPPPLPELSLLDKLAEAVDHVELKLHISADELKLIEPGSSMGGARPKITIADNDGNAWLAKFSRNDDLVSYPHVEFASMTLLAKTGARVPTVKLKHIRDNRFCYLIQRFDRDSSKNNLANAGLHFISANSLFNTERLRIYEDSRLDPAGYIALARIIRKITNNPKDECLELFKRLVFNIIIGNTDDHARNFAMIYRVSTQQWQLSPGTTLCPLSAAKAKEYERWSTRQNQQYSKCSNRTA